MMQKRAAAALVAVACTIQIGAWFAWWQTAWVYDDQALWHFQWALATALVFIRVVSLHVFATGTSRKAVWTWHTNRAERYDALKWHAYQFGWDAMVPMALLGVPAQQFSPPLRALGLSH